MRTAYLAAIAIAVLAAGLAVNSLPLQKHSTPATTQVADRLALSVEPFLMRRDS
jgi:hypothetical protein